MLPVLLPLRWWTVSKILAMTVINYDTDLCLEMNAGEINSFLIVKDTGTPSKTSSQLMFSG
jgi:hypothetical protein